MNQQEFEKLKRDVAELMTWKEQRIRQQLTFPIDKISKDILTRDFIRYEKALDFTSSSGQVFPNILVNYSDTSGLISVTKSLQQFSASTSNVITCNNHRFENDTAVSLLTTDTFPAPLSDVAPYYIISATANTFKLSTTLGGTEVDITSTGSGDHYVYFYN